MGKRDEGEFRLGHVKGQLPRGHPRRDAQWSHMLCTEIWAEYRALRVPRLKAPREPVEGEPEGQAGEKEPVRKPRR